MRYVSKQPTVTVITVPPTLRTASLNDLKTGNTVGKSVDATTLLSFLDYRITPGGISCQDMANFFQNYAEVDPVTGELVFDCGGVVEPPPPPPTNGSGGSITLTLADPNAAYDVLTGTLTLTDTPPETYSFSFPNLEVITNG